MFATRISNSALMPVILNCVNIIDEIGTVGNDGVE